MRITLSSIGTYADDNESAFNSVDVFTIAWFGEQAYGSLGAFSFVESNPGYFTESDFQAPQRQEI